MSTVGSSVTDGGTIDLSVGDVELAGVQFLALTVGLEVVEENEEEAASLLGPGALIAVLDVVALGVTTETTVVLGEGDDGLVGNDVVEVLLGGDDVLASDGLGDGNALLEVNAEIRTRGHAA